MYKNITIRLRFTLSMFIVPLVIMVVISSGFLSSLEFRKSMVHAANRHLAYKAEQLRDYMYSEWSILDKLDLEEDLSYRRASESSFLSYSRSLLRSETEKILVFDSQGTLLHQVSLQISGLNTLQPQDRIQAGLNPGWYSGMLTGEERVAVLFAFEPFEWTVAVSELESRFFSGLQELLRIQTLILVISMLAAVFLVLLYVRRSVRPLEKLAAGIEHIAATHNLGHRVAVENNDETGFIAERFNNMISALQIYHQQLDRAREAEVRSREKAIRSEQETLHLLGRVSDFRDEKTGEHQDRISVLSALFSALIGQDKKSQQLIMSSARLHDIGKIAIPDRILLKPGKLTVEEFEIIKTHATLGYELLKDSKSEALQEGAIIAYTHHEHWDGNGYPRKLSGKNIPLSGRIVGIVDVFDALTSERPYKEAWPPEKAREYIAEQRGKQFDPELVDLFIENFGRFAKLL